MQASEAAVSSKPPLSSKPIQELESAVIRFCGDSGDGMQLIGAQFTNVSAIFGNDVSTFPDFPAEIRAPVGTLAGVSGFQLHFSSKEIFTPGDAMDALVVMNPAALKTNLADLKRGGILICNSDEFDTSNLDKAGYASNPLDDPQLLAKYNVHKVPMTRLTRDAVEGLGLSTKEAGRCKNFFSLGLVYWLFDRDPTATLNWIKDKFKKGNIGEANRKALQGGLTFGEATDSFVTMFRVGKAKLPAGKYRKITGNEATAWGLATAAARAGKTLYFSGYPITPASDILHELAMMKNFKVRTFQAEDEIAAMASVCGAAFAGEIAATASSGPGICLKGEAMGLGVMTELPMVIVDVQRGGPSTGLPTKTEQADLLLAMFGRNSDSPMPIIAASGPADCFDMVQEAVRIAVEFMTPVIFLTDGYIANGSEPWRIPTFAELPPIKVVHPGPIASKPLNGDAASNGHGHDKQPDFLPYLRNEKGARPWAIPGTAGLEHRIGGIEKKENTGNIDYGPENHHKMVMTRMNKVAGIANHIPLLEVDGPAKGKLLVLSWGGTYGAVRTAVQNLNAAGKAVAHAHLKYMNPFPRNLGEILKSYEKVLIPELNTGQLSLLIRGKFLVDAIGYNKIAGKPFFVHELTEKINQVLEGK